MGRTILLFILALIVPVRAWPQSSQTIRDEISDGIDRLENIGSHDLAIDVRMGRVTLSGTVASQDARERIANLAQRVEGVDEVEDNLLVKPSNSGRTSELALAVRDSISSISQNASYQLQITVSGSVVTLSGDVFSEIDRKTLEDLALRTPGVTSVINNLAVTEPDDDTLGKVVEIQIQSSPSITIQDLAVRSENGVVTLTGRAKTHRDLDEALSIALNVPGVRDVKSEIKSGR